MTSTPPEDQDLFSSAVIADDPLGNERPPDVRGFRRRWRAQSTTGDVTVSNVVIDLIDDCEETAFGTALNTSHDRSFPHVHDAEAVQSLFEPERVEVKAECRPLSFKKLKTIHVGIVDVEDEDQVDVPMFRDAAELRIANETTKVTNFQQFKFPWESGRLASVFASKDLVKSPSLDINPGGRNFVQLNVKFGPRSEIETTATTQCSEPPRGLACRVVRSTDHEGPQSERELQRSKSLTQWWELLAEDMNGSTIGRKVLVEADPDDISTYAIDVLNAVFSVKSPGTLNKRLYGLKLFKQWVESECGQAWLPLSEAKAWAYIRFLKESNAPATRAISFVEACRFGWFLLGLEGADEVQSSLRIKGGSALMKAEKAAWKPADLMTTSEVLALHRFLEDEAQDLSDRIVVGHFLHLLYSRSRWSDLRNVLNFFMDDEGQYIEVQTRIHKGARSAELKSKLLPIVAPCKGITSDNWASRYVELRHRTGLTEPTARSGPMLRAPLNQQGQAWTNRAMESDEGSDLLRLVLKAPKTNDRRISSHSLKSTAMSWCSKFGIKDTSLAVLARHVSSVKCSAAVYSRDLITPVLREFDSLMLAMRGKAFDPDKSRSGMFTPNVAMAAQGTPQPMTQHRLQQVALNATPVPGGYVDETGQVVVTPLPWDEESMASEQPAPPNSDMESGLAQEQAAAHDRDALSETTEDDSVQSTSSSEAGAEVVGNFEEVHLDELRGYWINKFTLVVHRAKSTSRLQCGRPISGSYERSWELNGIRCSRCFDV